MNSNLILKVSFKVGHATNSKRNLEFLENSAFNSLNKQLKLFLIMVAIHFLKKTYIRWLKIAEI